jgi:hypothetical protein
MAAIVDRADRSVGLSARRGRQAREKVVDDEIASHQNSRHALPSATAASTPIAQDIGRFDCQL